MRAIGIAAAAAACTSLDSVDTLSHDERGWPRRQADGRLMDDRDPAAHRPDPRLTEGTVARATSAYDNLIVFPFLGGFLLAIAMEKWSLHVGSRC